MYIQPTLSSFSVHRITQSVVGSVTGFWAQGWMSGSPGADSARRMGPAPEREKGSSGASQHCPGWTRPFFLLWPSLQPGLTNQARDPASSAQHSPADRHVHILGLCPGWTALLTGCGLWSRRAGSGGSSMLMQPGLDYPGRPPRWPPLHLLPTHCSYPLLSVGLGERPWAQGLPVNPPLCSLPVPLTALGVFLSFSNAGKIGSGQTWITRVSCLPEPSTSSQGWKLPLLLTGCVLRHLLELASDLPSCKRYRLRCRRGSGRRRSLPAGTWGHSQEPPGLEKAALNYPWKGAEDNSWTCFFFLFLINTGQVKMPRDGIVSPGQLDGSLSPLLLFPTPHRQVREPSRLAWCFSAFEVALEKGTKRSWCRQLAHPFPLSHLWFIFQILPCLATSVYIYLFLTSVLWAWLSPPHPHPRPWLLASFQNLPQAWGFLDSVSPK